MAKRKDTEQPDVAEVREQHPHTEKTSEKFNSSKDERAHPSLSPEEEARAYTEFQPSIMLSRFGIRTAEDARRFLESPEGEVEMGHAATEIAHHKAAEEERVFEERQAMMLHARIRAFIIHWILEKEAHAEHRLMDQTKEQNEKQLERAKQNLVKEDQYKARERALEQYDNKLHHVHDQLLKNAAQTADLHKELEQLQKLEASILAKYKVLDELFHEFDASMPTEGMWSHEEIGERIALLHKEMHEQSDAINEVMAGDNQEEVMALRHGLHGLHLKLAHLQEMQAVHQGEKYFVNSEGEEVNSFRKADFILSKGQKIVKHDNQLYLLEAGQDWNAIKESPSALKIAQAAFEHAKPQLMPVRKAIHHHRELEMADHRDKVLANQQKLAAVHQEKQLLDNQVRQLQAARADVANALRRPNADVEAAPKPTPTAGSGHAHKPSTAPTMQFRQQVKDLKAQQDPNAAINSKMTPNMFFDLIAKRPNSGEAILFLKQYFKNMPSNMLNSPLQQNRLQFLLKNMERFGIDIIPDVGAPGKGKVEPQKETDASAPTPFNMKPHPLK